MEAISVKNLRVGYENNTIIEDMSLSCLLYTSRCV